MFPWERYVWSFKRDPHDRIVLRLNRCMEARQRGQNPHGKDLPLSIYLVEQLAFARTWRVFSRPVLP